MKNGRRPAKHNADYLNFADFPFAYTKNLKIMQLEQKIGISIQGACLGYYSLEDVTDLVRHFVFCAEFVSGKDFCAELITKNVNGKEYCFLNIVEFHG